MPHQPAAPGPTPPAERLAAIGVVALVVATVLLGALLPNRQLPAPRTAAEDAGCLEWTDGCRVCQRFPDEAACSMPGIACEPGEPRCLRRAGG